MPGSERDAPWTVAVTPVRLQREINFPLGTLVVKVIRGTQKDERRPLILENGCAEFVRLGLVASLALSFEFASLASFLFSRSSRRDFGEEKEKRGKSLLPRSGLDSSWFYPPRIRLQVGFRSTHKYRYLFEIAGIEDAGDLYRIRTLLFRIPS